MKVLLRMSNFARFLALSAACFSLVSCTNTISTPSLVPGSNGSGGSGGSGSTSISYGTPEILATIAKQSTVTNAAAVILYTTSQPVTTATVTLTGPSALSLPLTFYNSLSIGTTFAAYYYSVNTWTYMGNQNYTMTVSYGGKNFQSTITSVGNVVFSPSSSGITISWQGGGNKNTVSAFGGSPYNSYTNGPNAVSPYFFAKSGLGGYISGNYTVGAACNETIISAFSGGAFLGSSFTASDQESTTY